MSFVLDTNFISEARKGSRADAGVRRWLSSVDREDLYLSVLAVGEVRQGIEGLRRRDRAQAEHLEGWLSELRRLYAYRILPVDAEIAQEWGRTNVPDPISTRDSLMAATAKDDDPRHPQNAQRRRNRRASARPFRRRPLSDARTGGEGPSVTAALRAGPLQ